MPALSEHLRLAPALAEALRAGGRIAVIGPTGWLGSAALAMLDRALPDGALSGDRLSDRVSAYGSRRRTLALPSGRTLECRDMAALDDASLADAAVLHLAYLTRDRAGTMPADDYVAANEAIHSAVVAAVGRARGVFFASSGAVYQVAGDTRPAADRDLYGWMKRRHERAFEALGGDVAVVVARIFSVAGEYINKPEAYALSSMLAALGRGEPVRLRSAHEVWRSYAYVGDIVNLALSLLLARRSEPAFDIAGDEPIEIGRLAALCLDATGRPEAGIERPAPDGPDSEMMRGDVMLGDPTRYRALLAEAGVSPLPLAEQVRATAGYLDAVRGA